jgi:glucan 1,3-beta-glucosidase
MWLLVSFRPRPRKTESPIRYIFIPTNHSRLSRYYQPNPDAKHSPYPINPSLFDPDFSECLPGNCDALGLRILNTDSIAIYGAGHYSFFDHYSTTCSDYMGPTDCQSELVSIEGTAKNLWVHGLNTVGTPNMVVLDFASVTNYSNNIATYPDTIAYFAL